MAIVSKKRERVRYNCPHHWIIESATGPVSKGVCRFCGAEKEFNNYLKAYLGEDGQKVPQMAGEAEG